MSWGLSGRASGVQEVQSKMLKVLHIVQLSWLLNHTGVSDFLKGGGEEGPQTLQQGYQRTSGSLEALQQGRVQKGA